MAPVEIFSDLSAVNSTVLVFLDASLTTVRVVLLASNYDFGRGKTVGKLKCEWLSSRTIKW